MCLITSNGKSMDRNMNHTMCITTIWNKQKTATFYLPRLPAENFLSIYFQRKWTMVLIHAFACDANDSIHLPAICSLFLAILFCVLDVVLYEPNRFRYFRIESFYFGSKVNSFTQRSKVRTVFGEANGDFKCINEKSLKWQIHLRNKQLKLFNSIEMFYFCYINEFDVRKPKTRVQRPSQRVVAFEDFIYAYQFLNRLCLLLRTFKFLFSLYSATV